MLNLYKQFNSIAEPTKLFPNFCQPCTNNLVRFASVILGMLPFVKLERLTFVDLVTLPFVKLVTLKFVKSKTRLKFMKLACYHGAASTCHGKIVVPFWARLGICFSQTIASHNKHDGFNRERPTFGYEMISCLLLLSNFLSCQHRTTRVLCQFLGFFGVCLDIFMH